MSAESASDALLRADDGEASGRQTRRKEFASEPSASPVATGEHAWPHVRYAWYVAVLLTAAYTLSFIDRQILGLLLEPIRRDLQLTDTQASLLAGAAFALFYVTVGLPLGRWADHSSRRILIFVGIFLWSLMTAACGLAGTFWQLFAARVGVGIGEAALTPAAHSLISDYFPPGKRVRPLAMYNLALAIGAGLAYLVGGAISTAVSDMPHAALPFFGEVKPWQATFVAVGAPGMLFALLILTVREPLRRGVRRLPAPQIAMASASSGRDTVDQAAEPGAVRTASVRDVWRFIRRENPQTFLVLFFAYGGFAIFTDAILVWMPTVFMRRFGWDAGRIGFDMGIVILIAATSGILGATALAARLRAKGTPDALLRTSLIMGCTLTPIGIWLPLAGTPTLVLVLLAPMAALAFGLYAVLPPILQLITPNQMRGQVAALFSLFNNVLSLICGATCVAVLTEQVFRNPALLHYSLGVIAALVLPLSALLMWWGLPHFGRSLIAARDWMERTG